MANPNRLNNKKLGDFMWYVFVPLCVLWAIYKLAMDFSSQKNAMVQQIKNAIPNLIVVAGIALVIVVGISLYRKRKSALQPPADPPEPPRPIIAPSAPPNGRPIPYRYAGDERTEPPAGKQAGERAVTAFFYALYLGVILIAWGWLVPLGWAKNQLLGIGAVLSALCYTIAILVAIMTKGFVWIGSVQFGVVKRFGGRLTGALKENGSIFPYFTIPGIDTVERINYEVDIDPLEIDVFTQDDALMRVMGNLRLRASPDILDQDGCVKFLSIREEDISTGIVGRAKAELAEMAGQVEEEKFAVSHRDEVGILLNTFLLLAEPPHTGLTPEVLRDTIGREFGRDNQNRLVLVRYQKLDGANPATAESLKVYETVEGGAVTIVFNYDNDWLPTHGGTILPEYRLDFYKENRFQIDQLFSLLSIRSHSPAELEFGVDILGFDFLDTIPADEEMRKAIQQKKLRKEELKGKDETAQWILDKHKAVATHVAQHGGDREALDEAIDVLAGVKQSPFLVGLTSNRPTQTAAEHFEGVVKTAGTMTPYIEEVLERVVKKGGKPKGKGTKPSKGKE